MLDRRLAPGEIARLEKSGCRALNWELVTIHPESDLSRICRVDFRGRVDIGLLSSSDEISDVMLDDCSIGNHPQIRRTGLISGATIGDNVIIERCNRIFYEPEAACGLGCEVSVLDESGSRPVYIYPGLSVQTALIMAFRPQWTEEVYKQKVSEMPPLTTGIGNEAVVRDAGILKNVHVGAGTFIEGAARLEDGALINNAPASGRMAYIGSNVDAKGFIVEDGSVDAGAILRHCYVGQGASLDKGFTAHDSLFFANSAMENGEACAIIAGPFTVSMHKSTLLIGALYSFFNAGSGTNASNHMYKVGPVHWGVMERGVKTSSGAYIMWGGRIGAFSLLMGSNKKHPDTHIFPFSYVIGSDSGDTTVLPARMLGSCGLQRDALKWPTRDRRVKARLPKFDRIVFSPLNPATIGSIIDALRLADKLLAENPDLDIHRLDGYKIKSKHLSLSRKLYKKALLSYLHTCGAEKFTPKGDATVVPQSWIDLGGLPIPESMLDLFNTSEETCTEPETMLDDFFANYEDFERDWIESFLTEELRREVEQYGEQSTTDLEEIRNADRTDYVATVAEEARKFGL